MERRLTKYQFHAEYRSLPDRAAAVLAGAILEDLVKEYLRSFFVEDKEVANKLLGESGVLSAFAVQVRLLYLLGHFDKERMENMLRIAIIRNKFAHQPYTVTFATQMIRDLCRNLKHGSADPPESQRDENSGDAAKERLLTAVFREVSYLEHLVATRRSRQ